MRDAVERDRELDDAEVRADVPALGRRDGDDLVADLLGERLQVGGR